MTLAAADDLCFYPVDVPGPVGIGRGTFNKDLILTAAGIIARYSDGQAHQPVEIAYRRVSQTRAESITTLPLPEGELNKWRI